LAHIPAYAPSPSSLQLVIVVSDDDDDADESEGGAGMVRPLLEEVQRTPGGIERRHPIAMVMVGGGEVAYQRLSVAAGVGVVRRYFVESQGVLGGNLIVDEGDGL
jgi:hypothetical protein